MQGNLPGADAGKTKQNGVALVAYVCGEWVTIGEVIHPV